jgi:PEP-CTERM motif
MSDRRRHPTCVNLAGWIFALILLFGVWPANAGVLSTSDVLAKTGQSIDAWGAAWWQNAFVHPELLGDATGEFGYLGNVGGPVFFAEGSGGGTVSLSYAVPNDQFILLPVATYIWTFFDPCASVDCAAAIVNSFVSGIRAPFASVDGVPVLDLASHLVTVDTNAPLVFQVDAGPIDSTGYGGILDAVQGGLWLMLDPLSSGVHTSTFGATVPSIDPNTGAVLEGSIDLATNLQLTAVPEPSTVVLLCAGGLALAFGLRCRKRNVAAVYARSH